MEDNKLDLKYENKNIIMQNKIKIPKNQKSWKRYVEDREVKYFITSTIARDKYFLNEINEDGTLKRIATSKYPVFKDYNI